MDALASDWLEIISTSAEPLPMPSHQIYHMLFKGPEKNICSLRFDIQDDLTDLWLSVIISTSSEPLQIQIIQFSINVHPGVLNKWCIFSKRFEIKDSHHGLG